MGGGAVIGLIRTVGGGDQAELRIENSDQVVELAGPLQVARCFEEFLPGPHLALQVAAGFGDQGLENGPGGVLMAPTDWTWRASRGRSPARTSEDFPHPDGP